MPWAVNMYEVGQKMAEVALEITDFDETDALVVIAVTIAVLITLTVSLAIFVCAALACLSCIGSRIYCEPAPDDVSSSSSFTQEFGPKFIVNGKLHRDDIDGTELYPPDPDRSMSVSSHDIL